MADSVDVISSPSSQVSTKPSGSEVTLPCARCHAERLPWELRNFGGKAICTTCYEATMELARGAIKAMPANEPRRLCSNCRAVRDPSLGSAWCAAVELGDERARICANFVSVERASVRRHVAGGRTALLDLWARAGEELRAALGQGNYETWLGKAEPVELTDTEIVLAIPDEYTRDWLEQRLQPVIRNALATAGFPDLSPRYVVEPREEVEAHESEEPHREAKAGFNPHYTFAEFIVGSGNRLAHASALACVDQPGRVYNPLVLWGGVGVGKTHLLQAIGQEAIDQGRTDVLYTTSEAFTNELIRAIREGSTGEFRQRYRSVDYLLIDDIQFIAGKEATQEEFFHTFNALHQAGKQVVVTCDRPPVQLRTLEDRLRSRFASGLTADIQPPDLETRVAILRAKAGIQERRVAETVLYTLASRVRGNVRELEGALNRLLALADLLGTEPSMDLLRTVLGDHDPEMGVCRPAEVLEAVSAYYRVKTSDLSSPQRDRSITSARHMAMYLLREEAKLSLIEIGNQLGGRNHSTVIYGCDKIAAEVRRKTRVRQDVQAIKQLMYGVPTA